MIIKIIRFITMIAFASMLILALKSEFDNQISINSNKYFTSLKEENLGVSHLANSNKTVLSDLYYLNSNNPEPEEIIEEEATIRDELLSLYETNNDLVGWISISNTNVNYPVVQSHDNDEYLNLDFNKSYDPFGTIFADMNSPILPLSNHNILYGHRTGNNTMFGDIVKYEDEDFFYDNPIINFDTIYEEYEWEIFSVYRSLWYYVARYDSVFETPEDYLVFLNRIQEDSFYPTDITLTEDDVILTLITCTYEFDNARFIVHARLKEK